VSAMIARWPRTTLYNSIRYRLMPNFAKPHAIAKYRSIVSRQLAPRLLQKPTPARSMAGRTRNMGRDGSTYQNVDCA
jgi:hypothetical protein